MVRGLRARLGSAGSAQGARGARYGLFASFDGGLSTLVNAVAAALPPASIRLQTAVDAVRRADNGSWVVSTSGGQDEFDALLLATPAPVSQALLRPLDAELADELGRVTYRSSATLQMAYREADLPPFQGAGFVVPRREGYLLRGCTWSHKKYAGRAPDGFGLLRLYFGEDAVGLEPAVVQARARQELESLLGIRAEPLFAHWAPHRSAVPHYRVGHKEIEARVRTGAARHSGLALAGSAFGGVGIPDVIAGAERAAELLYAAGR